MQLKIDVHLKYNGGPAFPPNAADLLRIYNMIQSKPACTVLEFGCGYSTYIISKALELNKKTYRDNTDFEDDIRKPFQWTCHSIDTNKEWLEECRSKIQPMFDGINYFYHSECRMTEFNGQVCIAYDTLPNIIFDFVYLDGPNSNDVKGSISGIFYEHGRNAMPVSADLLRLEPYLLNGTVILIDGRIMNVRFLMGNFKRRWLINTDFKNSYTKMQLFDKGSMFDNKTVELIND